MRRLALTAALITASLVGSAFAYRAYLVHQLRQPVIALLIDPESAQFRNERLFSGWAPGNSALCGEVNSKNRMGGYVGFSTFKSLPEYASIDDKIQQAFKLANDLPLCSFESAEAPWWHLRW